MQEQDVKDSVLIAPLDSFADRFPAPFPGGVTALSHGSLTAELWKAEGYDEMFWHDHPQDELYVIVSGDATFVSEDGEYPSLKAGDVVFCPARLKHNFKEFTDDFIVWIFVYGPNGGEGLTRRQARERAVPPAGSGST